MRIHELAVDARETFLVLFIAAALLGGCKGQHERAGEAADRAAGVKAGLLKEGPQQHSGELRDRAERDQVDAVKAQADAADARAKAIRTAADEQADALEHKADDMRAQAKGPSKSVANGAATSDGR